MTLKTAKRTQEEFGTINQEIREVIATRILENNYSIWDLDLLLNDYLHATVDNMSDTDKADIKSIRRTIKGV